MSRVWALDPCVGSESVNQRLEHSFYVSATFLKNMITKLYYWIIVTGILIKFGKSKLIRNTLLEYQCYNASITFCEHTFNFISFVLENNFEKQYGSIIRGCQFFSKIQWRMNFHTSDKCLTTYSGLFSSSVVLYCESTSDATAARALEHV